MPGSLHYNWRDTIIFGVQLITTILGICIRRKRIAALKCLFLSTQYGGDLMQVTSSYVDNCIWSEASLTQYEGQANKVSLC